jgi:thiol-disulfide isomerase/thioredoxin
MNVFTRTLLALSLVGLLAGGAPGQVNLGDTPQVRFKAFGTNQPVDIAQFRGSYVLLDFWATWCGPCVESMPGLKALYAEYKDKGLVVVGMSRDRDQAALANFVKAQQIEWVQCLDTSPDNNFAGAFGVNAIPKCFLLDPEGKVIWTGHAVQAEAAFVRAYKANLPTLVDPKTFEAGKSVLDELDTLLAGTSPEDAEKALRRMAEFPEAARKSPPLAARIAAIAPKLSAAADTVLAKVDPLVEAGNYRDAANQLRAMAKSLKGTPVAAKAQAKLDQLLADPKVKAALDQADREAAAAEALGAADALRQKGQHDQAYPRYQQIAKAYPSTPAGQSAADRVKAYEADAAFMKKHSDAAVGTKAKGLLSLAASYAKGGNVEMARKKYQEVIDSFPNTTYSDQAKAELKALK